MKHQRLKALAGLGLSLSLLAVTACGTDDTADAGSTPTATSSPSESETDESDDMEMDNGDDSGDGGGAIEPSGTGDPFADARTAASHMPMTAAALTGGIVEAADIKGSQDSPAAELRAGMTHLLQEHVYLAGIAVATAYHAGPDSPEFELAAETVDANSVEVAAAIGSVVPEEEESFLQSWRSHVGDFVTYAVAAAGDDQAGKQGAVDNLLAYAKSQGEFFNRITGGALPADAVEEEFTTHITSLAEAVDAFAAGDAAGYDKLKAAAEHMPMSAKALTGGIVEAADIEGNPNSPASDLRAAMTSMLNSHQYLASIAVFTAYTAGADSAEFEAAAATLDANSVDLSKAVGSVAGEDNEATFLQVWRAHIDDFVGYALAAAGDDEDGKTKELADLQDYSTNAGAFFEEITGGALTGDAVAAELRTHIETTAGAIDSLRAALVA